MTSSRLHVGSTRLSVFYDAGFFRPGNVFFRYREQRGWISISGMHEFFLKYVAQMESVPAEAVKLVDAHWYDGRLSTEASFGGQLEKDRDFELTLLREGVTTHFLPARETPKDSEDLDAGFRIAQKGVDVRLALDVLDLAHEDRFDVSVLIAGDEDFVPLVRKLSSLGKRTLVAFFDFDAWVDDQGKRHRATKCSGALQRAASFCLNFNQIIVDPNWRTKSEVRDLFFMPRRLDALTKSQ